jgi:hypothetical protein
MNLVVNKDFQLIKKDVKELKKYLFTENNINDWDKIIIIYNIYLFFSQLYILYTLIDIISKDNNDQFINQFKNIYIFFYILCCVKNLYATFIYNIAKIDLSLAQSFLKNTHKYFI